ncbi:hypothetical protein DNTS_016653 [Danionella cerebrum]|uniref:Nudix hydrolase domain-containing protein n=1 Tax=Danionella cerebrum TaxID=2873325 RepID=A0A553Q0C8_9TELE|nr:hypothetical protein DNTS_016653 [Danionella translucida]
MFRQMRTSLWLHRSLMSFRDTCPHHRHAASGGKVSPVIEEEQQLHTQRLHENVNREEVLLGIVDQFHKIKDSSMSQFHRIWFRTLKSELKGSDKQLRKLKRLVYHSELDGFLCKMRSSVLHAQICSFHRQVDTADDLRRRSWSECLSARNEARCRSLLQPNTSLYVAETKVWAAVLVCLCEERGEPALLFTLRSAKLKGKHKGDVSFAGGKREVLDQTVVDTALREAAEELGVSVLEDQVWGVLKPLRDASGMLIAPVLANLGPLEALSFKPNPSEVEEVFTLSLEHLCQPQNRGYTHFRVGDRFGYTLPVFLKGKHRVWGLTAMALEQALKIIVPSELTCSL